MDDFFPFTGEKGHIHCQHNSDGSASQYGCGSQKNRISDNLSLVWILKKFPEHVKPITGVRFQCLHEGVEKRNDDIAEYEESENQIP